MRRTGINSEIHGGIWEAEYDFAFNLSLYALQWFGCKIFNQENIEFRCSTRA